MDAQKPTSEMPDLHLKSGGKSMVKGGTHLVTGFRDFILRGNIVSWLIFTICPSIALSPGVMACIRAPSVKTGIIQTMGQTP